jgi:hypothetical protein
MRTTVSIESALLERAKTRARQRGQTLGQYVEDAVRRDLVSVDRVVIAPALPTFTRGTGMRSSIDPSSNRALYDALDGSGDLS